MAWKTINRNLPAIDEGAAPELSEAVREKIRGFLGRYESKRAVLLPALHIVQDANGHVSWSAMKEIAEILEIHPSDVIDTISFYTHFWTHEKGKKVITVCRSLSCEVMGGADVLDRRVSLDLPASHGRLGAPPADDRGRARRRGRAPGARGRR